MNRESIYIQRQKREFELMNVEFVAIKTQDAEIDSMKEEIKELNWDLRMVSANPIERENKAIKRGGSKRIDIQVKKDAERKEIFRIGRIRLSETDEFKYLDQSELTANIDALMEKAKNIKKQNEIAAREFR